MANIPLLLAALVHLCVCPFTKVEESFNLQAIHDIVYHRTNISAYDHFEFPGVVPRTFIGPLFISILSVPFALSFYLIGLNKLLTQYAARFLLSWCVIYTFGKIWKSVNQIFGKDVANWFLFVTLSQYHFMYYSSRTLPNIMALPLVLLAVDGWLKRQYRSFIWSSAAAVLIFRAEIALFVGTLLLFELYYRRITLIKCVTLAIPAGIFCLTCTIVVDTIFWRRPLWPEAEVFWFNVVLNKSGDYGTSPFLWYFYSALPRALGSSVLFVLPGATQDIRIRRVITPAVIYVALMSILPHKELRFIIYVFPLFNIAAAYYCSNVWENRHKRSILASLVVLHIVGNTLFTMLLLSVASKNYPGGSAIMKLQRSEISNSQRNLTFHIDVLSAQTGVSRFTQIYPHWTYDKREDLAEDSLEMKRFSYLLTEGKAKNGVKSLPYSKYYDVLFVEEAFSHIAIRYNHFPPLAIKTKPQIFVLKNKLLSKRISGNAVKKLPSSSGNIKSPSKLNKRKRV